MAEEIPFSKQMRLVTRDIHSLSDALVNAKLAVALTHNKVWGEGLLVFYEIFRYLEEAMVRLKDTPIAEFRLEGLMRTEAFQQDLAFYLGEDWGKEYSPRESVSQYLLHLMEIERSNPILLMAYIYHLYMGLLSGGQILSKKKQLLGQIPFNKTEEVGGDAVTNFGAHSVASLKHRIKETTDTIARTLDDSTRELLLEESKKVFLMNNTIIRSIIVDSAFSKESLYRIGRFIFIIIFIFIVILKLFSFF